MCRGEMRSSLGIVKIGILRLRLSRGLDARGCRLLRRRSVMPWWRRGSYATKKKEGEKGEKERNRGTEKRMTWEERRNRARVRKIERGYTGERERERERVCVCVCVSPLLIYFLFIIIIISLYKKHF